MNVYDFDKTIYDGESTIDFIIYYGLRHDFFGLFKLVPILISATLKYKFGKLSNEETLNSYGDISEKYYATKNCTIASYVKPFWDKNEKRIKSFYKGIQKDDDVVITLSPEFFVKEICNRIGIKHCLGTKVDVENGKVSFICFRDKKVQAFKEAFPDAEIENFYTDSMHDKPLMDLAKNVYMVKGNKITKIK